MNLTKTAYRVLAWLGVFMLIITNTSLAVADTYTETSTTHFNAGAHSNTQTTNLDGGEVSLTEHSALVEIPVGLFNGLNSEALIMPKIKADSDGILYAVWHEDDGDGTMNDIWFSKSSDGGENWISPVRVDNGDDGACQTEEKVDSILPDLVIDEESSDTPLIYVVWTDDRSPMPGCGFVRFYNVYFSSSLNGGTSWSADVKVNNFPSLSGSAWGGGGSYLSYWVAEEFGFWRLYATGGPKVAIGPSPDYNILVTWMNDEINFMDYDVYYSMAMPTTTQMYIFDADWTTPCFYDPFFPWGHEDPLFPDCEDAKIDDNDSSKNSLYSGVPAIDADQSTGTVTVAYEDQKNYPPLSGIQDIMYVQFDEWSGGLPLFPVIPTDIMVFNPVPYPITLPSSAVSDDPVTQDYFNYEPDLDDHEPSSNVFFTWTQAITDLPMNYYGSKLLDAGDNFPDITDRSNIMYDYDDGSGTHTDVSVNDNIVDGQLSLLSDIEGNLDDSDDVWITWTTYEGEDTKVKVMFDYSSNKGTTWHTDEKVAALVKNVHAAIPDLVFDYFTNAMHVIWNDMDWDDDRGDGTVDQDPYSTRSLDFGENWGTYYVNGPGQFVSRVIDLSVVTNVDYQTVSWSEELLGGNVQIQLKSAATQAGLAGESFVGPSGAGGYYTNPSGGAIYSGHDGNSWMQYLIQLTSPGNFAVSPYLEDITLSYGEGTGDDPDPDDPDPDDPDPDDPDPDDPDPDDPDPDDPDPDDPDPDDPDPDDPDPDDDDDDDGEPFDGFPDVDPGDPYFDAITFVGEEEIFEGDGDTGNFAPNRVINRVETVKVILEAFNFTIFDAPGTDFGFPDLGPAEWYMGHAFTAYVHQIMTGYPDGNMKPAQTVNKVEMLRIFSEAAGAELYECDTNPYPDASFDEWFCKYVLFAKLNLLVDTDSNGNFNPGDGMTRADVAELFYRYDQAFGL